MTTGFPDWQRDVASAWVTQQSPPTTFAAPYHQAQWQVPAGEFWQMQSLRCVLITDANVGNREMVMEIGTGLDIDTIAVIPFAQGIPASFSASHTWIVGLGSLASPSKDTSRAREIPTLILSPNWKVTVLIAGSFAGDTLNAFNATPTLVYRRAVL